MKKWTIVGIVVLLVSLGVAGVVYAQDEEPQFPFSPDGEKPFWGRGGRGGFMQNSEIHSEILDSLADRLDLTAEELQERIGNGETPLDIALGQSINEEDFQMMMDEIREVAIDNALAEGVITEEQAELMRGRFEKGDYFHWQTLRDNHPLRSEKLEGIAEKLGLDLDELQERFPFGEEFHELLEEEGLSMEDFQMERSEYREQALQSALEAGTITPEQVERMLEFQANRPFGKHFPGMDGSEEGFQPPWMSE